MKKGILAEEYKRHLKIALEFENGDKTFEEAVNSMKVWKPAAMTTKKYVAMALGLAKIGNEKMFNKITNLLIGTGSLTAMRADLLGKPNKPEEIEDRTPHRGQ